MLLVSSGAWASGLMRSMGVAHGSPVFEVSRIFGAPWDPSPLVINLIVGFYTLFLFFITEGLFVQVAVKITKNLFSEKGCFEKCETQA